MRMESGSAVDRCPRCGCGIRVECDLGQTGATFVLYRCGALVAWVQDRATGEWEILTPAGLFISAPSGWPGGRDREFSDLVKRTEAEINAAVGIPEWFLKRSAV